MKLFFLILGIVGIIAEIIGVILSVVTTPDNLRGFYGKKYIGIASVAIVLGTALVVFACIA